MGIFIIVLALMALIIVSQNIRIRSLEEQDDYYSDLLEDIVDAINEISEQTLNKDDDDQ